MIKNLIVSVVLVLMMFIITSSKAIAQVPHKLNKDSSITLPKSILKNGIKDIETGKYYYQQYKIDTSTINLLKQKVTLKDNIIDVYKQKDVNYERMLKNDTLIDKQKDIVIVGLTKDVKHVKQKLVLLKIVSIAVVGGISYLYITK